MTRSEAKEILQAVKFLLPIEAYTDRAEEALDMAIEALEHLDNIEAYMHDFDVTEEEATKALERKRGEWMYLYEDNYKCSKCGSWWCCTDSQIDEMNFCPNCGADMRGGNNDGR